MLGKVIFSALALSASLIAGCATQPGEGDGDVVLSPGSGKQDGAASATLKISHYQQTTTMTVDCKEWFSCDLDLTMLAVGSSDLENGQLEALIVGAAQEKAIKDFGYADRDPAKLTDVPVEVFIADLLVKPEGGVSWIVPLTFKGRVTGRGAWWTLPASGDAYISGVNNMSASLQSDDAAEHFRITLSRTSWPDNLDDLAIRVNAAWH